MRSISVFEQTLVAGGDYSPDVFSDGFAGNGWQTGGAGDAMGGFSTPSTGGSNSTDGIQVAGWIQNAAGAIIINIISNSIYDNFRGIYLSPAPASTPSSDALGNPANIANVYGA